MGLKVAKFGGTSLASAGRIENVYRIVAADPERRIVVVSAPGKRHPGDAKVTDLLIACAEAGLAGRGAEPQIAAVAERFAELAAGLGLPAALSGAVAEDLRARVAAPRDHEGRYTDALKAAGEDHCARLVAAFFRARGLEAHYVGPREAGLLLSDEYGNAQVLAESYARLAALARRPRRGRSSRGSSATRATATS